ncbi:MAG: saccharopine dehydrogenase NADP-binding domain-containing protein [SAR86 cluster bacterium]|jgi:short subunit dehydrogenase-like uncharacterized protein|nr:saccharopine dehydrogenase NADP-binding domain-containing protein [SAR86 cluster bacterium]
MNKELDIVIYGATGFTGKLCVKYFLENYNEKDFKWAIAGRNFEKLENINKEFGSNLEILLADSDDEVALDKITKRTKVILSTAGPFHRYSSKLVASCVNNKTHYTDITGENFWVKGLIDKHHEQAAAEGIRIVPSCGYDSLPSDLGTYFAIKEMNKPIKKVVSFHTGQGGVSGGTTETMFSMGDLKLGKEMQDLFLLNPAKSTSDIQISSTSDRVGVSKDKDIKSWSGPFIMAIANTRVVRRSAALFAQRQMPYGEDFIYTEKASYKSFLSAMIVSITTILGGIILFTPLRKLIRPLLPKPGEGPSEEVMQNGFFECLLLVEAEDGEKKIYRMFGNGDPGYRVTSKFVCESAISLTKDLDRLPGGEGYGGVLTASTGLGNILIERLKNVEIIFEGPISP